MSSQLTRRIRKICLALPDATESEKWGQPHFCVAGKIFAGCGDEKGTFALGCKLEMDRAARMVKLPGIWKAPYVGHKGWVSVDPTAFDDWAAIEEMIGCSYRLIAPRKSLEKLDDDQPARSSARKHK
ncbi:MAG: MmcQ/YjbR family DNA-binding protein [Pirellulaceae bacterium]